MMRKFIELLDLIITRFLIVLMATMVLAVTWQVFTRFIIQNPSSYTEELARFLLIWIGVLGASYALRTRSHLGIDLISRKVGPEGRFYVDIIVSTLISLFSFFVMIIGGSRLVSLTLDLNQISASMGIKVGYVYTVIPLSGVLLIIYSVLLLSESFQQWRAGREVEA